MHLPANHFICFLQRYCYSQVVSELCCNTYNSSTTLCTPDLAHNCTFLSNFLQCHYNISQISFYSFIINHMVHWTNTKLDTTLLSIAATILKTLLECTQLMNTKCCFTKSDMYSQLSTLNTCEVLLSLKLCKLSACQQFLHM